MKRAQGKIVIPIFILILLVGVLIVVDINNNRESSITGNVVKTLKNCRDVKVPYTINEDYNYYPKAQKISGRQEEDLELFGKGIYQTGTVSLKNIDNEGGWFTVMFNWETLNDELKDPVRHYINPDEVVDFVSQYDTSLGEDSKFTYRFEADPIQKTRTVTKYRTEERCD